MHALNLDSSQSVLPHSTQRFKIKVKDLEGLHKIRMGLKELRDVKLQIKELAGKKKTTTPEL